MIEFKKITKETFGKIDKYFALHLSEQWESRFCDYAPGTVKMWHEAYDMEYCEIGDLMLIRASYEEEEGRSYLMPVGKWTKDALSILRRATEGDEEAVISVIPEYLVADICREFEVSEERLITDRDWVDYIYLREEFLNPKGKKQHNYKNNLNKFQKEHPDHRVELLCKENTREAVEFFESYCRANPDSSSVDDWEYKATLPVIMDPEVYSMRGAVLYCEGRIIGLTLGEVFGDTVIVHTEKAEKSISGAYQTLAHGYQKLLSDDVVYINREEDMGLEGLRRSKNAYGPLRLEKKYTLYLNK